MGNLISLDRVKTQLFGSTEVTPFDALLSTLVAAVSERAADLRGGPFEEETDRVDYISGNGGTDLFLPHGPLVSITSVESVVYSDAGDGSRAETLTTVAEYLYIEHGFRAKGYYGRPWLERLSGYWSAGVKNYKVTYTSGFATIPESVQQAVTNETVAEFLTRDTRAAARIRLADFEMSLSTPERREEAFRLALAPFTMSLAE